MPVLSRLSGYVPAGHSSRHASLRGLSLLVSHPEHVTIGPALADVALREHFAQSSMPPLAVSLHLAHTFLPCASAVGKNPSLHSSALTQEAVPDSVFRYLSAWHSVHVAALGVPSCASPGFSHLPHPATPVYFLLPVSVTPVASPHQTTESCALLTPDGRKYPALTCVHLPPCF
eukprot:XP_001706731.1 Hypothetical protein GL50803_20260 [Giardia lamblia ATCC 50803]